MSATNTTPNIGLPEFVGTDKPAWLTDWNGAMNTIDSEVGAAKTDIQGNTTSIGNLNNSVSSLNTTVAGHTSSITALNTQTSNNTGSINTINSLIGNGTPTTTDQTIIGAINEINAHVGNIDGEITDINNSLSGKFLAKTVGFSASSDGTKTRSQLADELFASFLSFMGTLESADRAIVTTSSAAGVGCNCLSSIQNPNNPPASIPFSRLSVTAANLEFYEVNMMASGSVCKKATVSVSDSSVTYTDISSQVVPSGQTVTLQLVAYIAQ